jgi:hypothetical protein
LIFVLIFLVDLNEDLPVIYSPYILYWEGILLEHPSNEGKLRRNRVFDFGATIIK